jgi:hypothetical protein
MSKRPTQEQARETIDSYLESSKEFNDIITRLVPITKKLQKDIEIMEHYNIKCNFLEIDKANLQRLIAIRIF